MNTSITQRIKKSLGIDTNTAIGRELTDEYREVAPEPTAQAADTSFDDLETPLTEEETMRRASEALQTLELAPGSWSLIDRALDSLSRNDGRGLQDPDAREEAQQLAALVRACDNDLATLVQAVVSATPTLDVPGQLYRVLYRVLKNCVFFANLDYRAAEGMDAYSDEATVQAFFERYVSSTYVEEALGRVVDDQVLSYEDTREKEFDDFMRSEQGYELRREIELQYMREKYGSDELTEAVVRALEDVRLLFQYQLESVGWPNERPMPYANTQNRDGTFTPITDAMTALDAAEVARRASQQRRREERLRTLAKAQAAAAAIVAASLKQPRVHRVQR